MTFLSKNWMTPIGFDLARLRKYLQAGGGNALRAAVLGGTDGLTSNLALVMGVAGASPGRDVILLSGIAGLLAGSFSMALGEWISVTSSREAAESLLATERNKIALMPETVQDELALIYRAKGVPEQHSRELATHLMADPANVLNILATEELGIVPGELGSPAVAASMSAISFAAGAAMPLLPFLLVLGPMAILLSTLLAGIGLFTVGSLITVLTPHSSMFGGVRQLVLGLLIAGITFAIGAAIGDLSGAVTAQKSSSRGRLWPLEGHTERPRPPTAASLPSPVAMGERPVVKETRHRPLPPHRPPTHPHDHGRPRPTTQLPHCQPHYQPHDQPLANHITNHTPTSQLPHVQFPGGRTALGGLIPLIRQPTDPHFEHTKQCVEHTVLCVRTHEKNRGRPTHGQLRFCASLTT